MIMQAAVRQLKDGKAVNLGGGKFERLHPVTAWHRHKTRAWDFMQRQYPGIRKAEGEQLKFVFYL